MNRPESDSVSESLEHTIVDGYRVLISQDEQPRAESDQMILEHAQQAAAAQTGVHHSPRWAMPLSMLAALVVGFGLFAKMNDLIELPPSSASESPPSSKPAVMPVELIELNEQQKAQFRDMMAKAATASKVSDADKPPTARPAKPLSAPTAPTQAAGDVLVPTSGTVGQSDQTQTDQTLRDQAHSGVGEAMSETSLELAANQFGSARAVGSSQRVSERSVEQIVDSDPLQASQEPPANAIVVTGVGLRQGDRVPSQQRRLNLLRELMAEDNVNRFGAELGEFTEQFPHAVLPDDIVCFGLNHGRLDRTELAASRPDC